MAQTSELLLAGDLLFRTYDPVTATWATSWDIAEVDKLAIQTPADKIQRISNGRATYGQSRGGITVPKPTTFSLTFAAASIEMMRLKLAGTVEAINIASGTITEQSVTVVPGLWVEIGKENLAAAGLVVTNSAGTTTYVLNDHYEINYRFGLIKAIKGGPITAGPVKITATHNAVAGSRIRGAQQYRSVLELKLDGVNLNDGSPIYLRAWQAAVSSDSEHDFMVKGLATVPLSGELEIPLGRSEPFVIEYPEL